MLHILPELYTREMNSNHARRLVNVEAVLTCLDCELMQQKSRGWLR